MRAMEDTPLLRRPHHDALQSGTKPRISHFKQITDQTGITAAVEAHHYEGSGTHKDPFVVVWMDGDPRDPLTYSSLMKWTLTATSAMSTFAISLFSSAYTGASKSVIAEFDCDEEVATLGLSLFVLGFGVGPLLWAPLSELYGRQYIFALTMIGLTALSAGAAEAPNIASLIVLRALAGAIGSNMLTNSGAVISDCFHAKDRGLAMACYSLMPWIGPLIGFVIGGFVGEAIGWRWLLRILTLYSAIITVVGICLIPETYGPVILRRRAAKLGKITGKVYRSRTDLDAEAQGVTVRSTFNASLRRPWALLFAEPIVAILSIYMA